MGSLFRSEEMALCQLFLQSEAAYACVSELGELGLVQFRDLNPDVNAFQRKFVNEVRRCDEMERKLRYLEKEIKKDGIPMLDTGENPEAPQPREMIDLEATFEKLENELREVNQNAEALKRNYLELTELKHILRKTQVFFDEAEGFKPRQKNVRRPQMADPSREEEQVTLLGEEGLRAGGQALKLGLKDFYTYYGISKAVVAGYICFSILLPHFIVMKFVVSPIFHWEIYHRLHLLRDKCIDPALHHDGGVNPTESMTRALISDDAIARQTTLGPVQLGFPEKSDDPEDYLPCFVAGVILRERLPAFERMLWRACRGNVFLRQAEIEAPLEDPSTGDKVYKSVFIIFFQGDQLKSRVKKICEGFRATLYPCPEAPADRREMAMGVMTRIEDLNTVLGQTQDHRHRVLVAAAKNIKNWFIKVRKIKAIYHTLNFFNLDVTQKCLIAECWVPLLDLETIQLALRRGTERSGSSVPPILNRMGTYEDPPTYNRTNKFTAGFQILIDAYGVASYREMNPAPYTIITFPFLFAVMFGDVGHGLIMLLFATWMVLKEKPLAAQKYNNEIWNIFFGGRYIIFLMGLFSCYTGLIYNDVFSKSMNVFGSYWKAEYNISTIQTNKDLQLNPTTDYVGYPYPFGLDPVWQLATNKIIFQNAYKMKLSIIFGVAHMLFGVFISLMNYRYFKKTISIYVEFIPQIIFLCFLFVYMVLLMFIKWIKYYPTDDPAFVTVSPGCAPSILITFINMVLFKPSEPNLICTEPIYPGQSVLQKLFVIIAFCCIPVMLLGKPIYIVKYQNKHQSMNNDGECGDEQPVPGGEHGDEHDVSELFIHQGIHTIEYVLGSVSHTASYLRLWALSLAHAQLSEVLWFMIMKIGLGYQGWIGGIVLWIMFGIWATLTIAILVLMEGLSAFLHTLRLHWVEFQSKFYTGAGVAFQPFDFYKLVESSTTADDVK